MSQHIEVNQTNRKKMRDRHSAFYASGMLFRVQKSATEWDSARLFFDIFQIR